MLVSSIFSRDLDLTIRSFSEELAPPLRPLAHQNTLALFGWYGYGGIWMVCRNSGGICERKTLFRIKKEADQGFKGTSYIYIDNNAHR